MENKRRGHRPHPPQGWLVRDEVAAMVGVNRQTVVHWEKAGKLPKGRMYGSAKIWNKAVMERFLVTLEVEDGT